MTLILRFESHDFLSLRLFLFESLLFSLGFIECQILFRRYSASRSTSSSSSLSGGGTGRGRRLGITEIFFAAPACYGGGRATQAKGYQMDTREFTEAEKAQIAEKLTPEDFFQVEPSYVHHPIGDRLNCTPTGYAVYLADTDEGFLFDNLSSAIEKMANG